MDEFRCPEAAATGPADDIIMQGDVSRVLAKIFERAHRTVLRTYDNLKCSGEFMRHNFVPHEYLDEKGELRAQRNNDEGPLSMLVMSFVAPSVMALNEAGIGGFSAMATDLSLAVRFFKPLSILVLRHAVRSTWKPRTAAPGC